MRKLTFVAALFGGFALTSTASAQVVDPRVSFVNAGYETVLKIQMNDVGTGIWGRDLLGDNVLESGDQTGLTRPSGRRGTCYYDLRVTFVDETTLEVRNFDACNTQAVHIDDGDIYIETVDGDFEGVEASW